MIWGLRTTKRHPSPLMTGSRIEHPRPPSGPRARCCHTHKGSESRPASSPWVADLTQLEVVTAPAYSCLSEPRDSDECSQHARDHRSTPIQNNFPVPTHTHTWDEFGRILAPPDCPTRPVILSHTPHHAPRSILAVIWFRETAAGNFLAGGATFDELGRHGNLSRRGARGARWAAGGFGNPVSPFQWKAQYKMEEWRRPDLLGGV